MANEARLLLHSHSFQLQLEVIQIYWLTVIEPMWMLKGKLEKFHIQDRILSEGIPEMYNWIKYTLQHQSMLMPIAALLTMADSTSEDRIYLASVLVHKKQSKHQLYSTLFQVESDRHQAALFHIYAQFDTGLRKFTCRCLY